MSACWLWRLRDVSDVRSFNDESGRSSVMFWSRRAVRVKPGDIVVPVLTQATRYGRRVAVPGVYCVQSASRHRASCKLVVWQGSQVEWTEELRADVGRKVQSPVEAKAWQLLALERAGVLLEEARRIARVVY